LTKKEFNDILKITWRVKMKVKNNTKKTDAIRKKLIAFLMPSGLSKSQMNLLSARGYLILWGD